VTLPLAGQAARTSNLAPENFTILDLRPDQSFYRPGQPVRLRVKLQAAQPAEVGLYLKITYLEKTINTFFQRANLKKAPEIFETTFTVYLPPETPRGYGFELAVKTGKEAATLATASTAADVLDGWPQMPRYGFFANFKSEETEEESFSRAETLAAYHVNVVQFYDWMYRHEDFIPPADEFIDPMGRAVSYATVKHKIAAAHHFNMATLAYGAVYGATPAFWEAHQSWGMYQADGTPYSLERLFYLMDISLGKPWAENILNQYEKAVTIAGFDGIHVDQYGYPKLAYTQPENGEEKPETLELAQLFPPIINAAAERVAPLKPGAGVIFNAVNNWPIETVAPTGQSAVYIEVWPPYVEYKDLHDLIINAQRLAGSSQNHKQVILAAYLSPFLPEGLRLSDNSATDEAPHAVQGHVPANPAEKVAGAENAALLATAAIYASGGFHLLLGEKNGVLADPYYPYYGQFQPDFALKMRHYYDFLVRYENVLSDPTTRPLPSAEVEATVEISRGGEPIEVSGEAKAGQVWVLLRQGKSFTTLNLVNLQGLHDSLWNAFKETPTPLAGLTLTLTLPEDEATSLKKAWLASPDGDASAQEIALSRETLAGNHQRLTLEIPGLDYWDLLVFEKE